MAETDKPDLTTLTVTLLSAYVTNNSVESGDLAGLIQSTHSALSAIDAPGPAEPEAAEYAPAVTARKSLGSRDHILSMINGQPYKALKRHLSSHGLTPAEYRERYKLPATYPMVAESYSEKRREVAARLGLGRRPKSSSPLLEEPVPPVAEPMAEALGAPTETGASAVPEPAPAKAKRSVQPTAEPMKEAEAPAELAPAEKNVAVDETAPAAPPSSRPTRAKAAKADVSPTSAKASPKSAKPVADAAKPVGREPAASKPSPKKRLGAKFADPVEAPAE